MSEEDNKQPSTKQTSIESTPKKTSNQKTPRKTPARKNQTTTDTSTMTNFYEFETKKFFDDVYNATLDYGCDGLDDIQMILNGKYPDSKNEKIIKESLNKAQDILTNSINYGVDAFEIYVTQNVLELPKGFQKSQETKITTKPISKNKIISTEENVLNEKIIKLRKEINEVNLKNFFFVFNFFFRNTNLFKLPKQKMKH